MCHRRNNAATNTITLHTSFIIVIVLCLMGILIDTFTSISNAQQRNEWGNAAQAIHKQIGLHRYLTYEPFD